MFRQPTNKRTLGRGDYGGRKSQRTSATSSLNTPQPSSRPTSQPTSQPSRQPTSRPTRQPTLQPSRQATSQPSCQPACHPTRQPSSEPTGQPASHPSPRPTSQPTLQPSLQPLPSPTAQPSMQPSSQPSRQPSMHPSSQPTAQPSLQPSSNPSLQPLGLPTSHPSCQPSQQSLSPPSQRPSAQPSIQPSCRPFSRPTFQPMSYPSSQPTGQPAKAPTFQPSSQPTQLPTLRPTLQPMAQPTLQPSKHPTSQPTSQPSSQPSAKPTFNPTLQPTAQPSVQPSGHPTICPSKQPTSQPLSCPSCQPSMQPSSQPTHEPTSHPTLHTLGGRTAQPSLLVTRVSISPSNGSVMTGLNPTARIVVTGSVFAATISAASWSVKCTSCHVNGSQKHLNLSSASLTPASVVMPSRVVVGVHLVLAPNTLTGGGIYRVSLSCLGTVASITLEVNKPPQPGTFSIEPPMGKQLVTIFSMVAHGWHDADTPLSYAFSFLTPSSEGGTPLVLPLQARSPLGWANATLPGGNAEHSYALTIVVTVWDSLNASTSQQRVVRVDPPSDSSQVTASILTVLSTTDLATSPHLIPTLTSVLNRVNCSGAPGCSSLNRLACSVTANTCGSCVEGFVGTPGPANTPCLSPSTLSTGSGATTASKSKACSSHRECGAWYYCNSKTAVCQMASQQCVDPLCSGHGQCSFANSNTGAMVSTCLLSDVTCEATCVCSSGYFGATCSTTAAALEQAQGLRSTLLQGFLTTSSSSNPSPEELSSSASTLAALTQQPLELTPASAAVACTIAMKILNASLAANIPYTTVTPIVTSLDSILMVPASANPFNVSRRLMGSSDGTRVQTVVDTLSQYGSLVAGQSFEGQSSVDNVRSSFSMTTQVHSAASGHVTASVPLKPLEQAMGVTSTRVHIPLQSRSPAQPIALTLIEVKAKTLGIAAQNLTSNIVRVNGNVAQSSVQVFLPASSSKATPIMGTLQSNHSFVTDCERGDHDNYTSVCPWTSYTIRHHCPGHPLVMTSTCPPPVLKSRCLSPFGTTGVGGGHQVCQAVSYSPDNTTCLCPAKSPLSSSGRRLGSLVENAAINVVTMSAFVAEEMAQTFSYAPYFTAGDVQRVIIVISIFVGLWSTALANIICVFFRDFIFNKKTEENDSDGKDGNDGNDGSDSNNGKDDKTNKVDKNAPGGNAQSPMEPHPNHKKPQKGKANTEKVDMRLFLRKAFPKVFVAESTVMGFLLEVWNHHDYLELVKALIGSESFHIKVVKIVRIFSVQTLLVFCTALFFDLQAPDNDGSCPGHKSASSCLTRKSPLNQKWAYCVWNDDTEACSYNPPTVNSWTMVVEVGVLTTFAMFLLMKPIQRLFYVLHCPTKKSNNAKDGEKGRNEVKNTGPSGAVHPIDEREVAPRPPVPVPTLAPKVSGPLPVVMGSTGGNGGKGGDDGTGGEGGGRASLLISSGLRRSILEVLTITEQGGVREVPEEVEEARARVESQMPELRLHLHEFQARCQTRIQELRQRTMTGGGGRGSGGSGSGDSDGKCRTALPEVNVGEMSVDDLLERLLLDLVSQAQLLSGEEKTLFCSSWCMDEAGHLESIDRADNDIMLRGLELFGVQGSTVTLKDPARVELEAVKKLTVKTIERLRNADGDQRGVEVLHAFVLDMLGRKTNAARVLANKIDLDFEKRVEKSWQAKALAWLGVALVNFIAIYFTVLRAAMKSRHWQELFLNCWIIQVVLEVILCATMLCVWLNYVLPHVVKDDVDAALKTLDRGLKILERGHSKVQLFNIAPFFLVSWNVAVAHPELLESAVVQAYFNHLPEGNILHDINTLKGRSSKGPHQGAVAVVGVKSGYLGTVYAAVKAGFNNVLYHLVSLPLDMQVLFVQSTQPIVTTLAVYVVTNAMSNNLTAVAAGVLAGGLVVGCMFQSRVALKESARLSPVQDVEAVGDEDDDDNNDSADDAVSSQALAAPVPVPTLGQGPNLASMTKLSTQAVQRGIGQGGPSDVVPLMTTRARRRKSGSSSGGKEAEEEEEDDLAGLGHGQEGELHLSPDSAQSRLALPRVLSKASTPKLKPNMSPKVVAMPSSVISPSVGDPTPTFSTLEPLDLYCISDSEGECAGEKNVVRRVLIEERDAKASPGPVFGIMTAGTLEGSVRGEDIGAGSIVGGDVRNRSDSSDTDSSLSFTAADIEMVRSPIRSQAVGGRGEDRMAAGGFEQSPNYTVTLDPLGVMASPIPARDLSFVRYEPTKVANAPPQAMAPAPAAATAVDTNTGARTSPTKDNNSNVKNKGSKSRRIVTTSNVASPKAPIGATLSPTRVTSNVPAGGGGPTVESRSETEPEPTLFDLLSMSMEGAKGPDRRLVALNVDFEEMLAAGKPYRPPGAVMKSRPIAGLTGAFTVIAEAVVKNSQQTGHGDSRPRGGVAGGVEPDDFSDDAENEKDTSSGGHVDDDEPYWEYLNEEGMLRSDDENDGADK